jgi:predicted amidophosphoribosyltransferase
VLLDLLLPRRCVVCGDGGATLCAICTGARPALMPPLCARCGAPTAWPVERCRECAGRRLAFVSARAAVPYDDTVRRVVRRWKEHGLRSLAGAAADVVAARVTRPVVDVVTFVPAEPWRARSRGHHPAERLARELAERWALPCRPLLARRGPALSQRGLSRAQRQRNPAFSALETGLRAALVDDVYTTGATANAAARALGGRVEVVTLARTVRRA